MDREGERPRLGGGCWMFTLARRPLGERSLCVCGLKGNFPRGERNGPATNATSHGRRSFLVVMAASWRSRQRPSPLRGGHDRGICPFVVVPAEVFFTPTQKQRKKTLHMRLPPFFITGTCFGFAPLRGTCAARRDFRRNRRKRKTERKKPKIATSTSRGRWSCGSLRRAALKVTAIFCGHGRWFFLEVFLGF